MEFTEEFTDEALDGYPVEYQETYEDVRPHQSSYVVPDNVRNFLIQFQRHVNQRHVDDIHQLYDSGFNRLTERFYKTTAWPSEVVGPLVNGDPLFLILYRELFFRHIYARLQPDVYHRCQSYYNYCDLFNHILSDDDPLNLSLPTQWLWDIVDEFIYQFQSFTQYRSKLSKRSTEEIDYLRNHQQVWNVHSVLNVLHSLVEKSNINPQLEAINSCQDPEKVAGTYGGDSLYRNLGYYSLIGLCRLHCLLGDYRQALKVLDRVDLNKKSTFANVPTCRVTLFYYVGFAYLMMRRYTDAIRTFCSILLYLQRTKLLIPKSYQYDQMVKQTEKMYHLLAISLTFCPMSVDESVNSSMRDKCGERMHRLTAGDEKTFTDMFSFACPKFLSPVPPPLDAGQDSHMDAFNAQNKIFLSEVRQQGLIPVIRSYLQLYTSMPIAKMAAFMDLDVEEFRTHLLRYKHKMYTPVWTSGPLLGGELKSVAGTDFFIEGEMIHITDTSVARPYGEYFVRETAKVAELNKSFRSMISHMR
ncbi:eukaryotic translation initiation factor 3 subunit L-like [Sycon ciliatum]|uniref:eukaryotic translation initiation factor 3 subunit L-like n=1 Tax=Sycon ciliatum TaxID=27933 RepID=UPI0031F5F5D2